MNAEQNPLLRYDSLLQQYAERVEPLLTQLRERVDNELDRIRHQEATLLADRLQALQELQTAIGIDARFLLAKKLDRDYFQRKIEWLVKMSVTAYSVHPGSYTDFPEAAWDLFLTNLAWLRTQCSSHNIELGIETMYPIRNENRRYFLDDLNSIDRLHKILPDLKWVLDLAHLNLWREHRLEVLELLGDRLLEIHISDNDGRRDLHTVISEKTWWLPYLEILPTSVPYVLETRLTPIRSGHSIAIEYQRVVELIEN
jgi:sugar phosphate isomerase/epimerase